MSSSRHKEYVSKYNFLLGIKNLTINFGPVEDQYTHPLEQVYIHNIFKYLVAEPSFEKYKIYLLTANGDCNYPFDHNSIVFYLSNEDHIIPYNILKSKVVFSPYCPVSLKLRPSNCFPIPLGYNGSLKELEMVNIKDRINNVFFSGNLHRRRLSFYLFAKLYKLKKEIRALFGKDSDKEMIIFSRSFTGGISPEEYSNILMNSKIALVPEGYKSDISFRFFEAAKYGCIIITPRLYDFWYYSKFPGIQLDNWGQLPSVLKVLKKDPVKLQKIHELTKKYYDNYCSEKAVAGFIISTVAMQDN